MVRGQEFNNFHCTTKDMCDLVCHGKTESFLCHFYELYYSFWSVVECICHVTTIKLKEL